MEKRDYLAGLTIPIGTAETRTSLKEDDQWNVAGEVSYEVPTPYMKDKLDRRTGINNMLFHSFEETGQEVGTYNPDDAVRDGLSWLQRHKVEGVLEDLGEVSLNSNANLPKGMGGATASSPNLFGTREPSYIKVSKRSKSKEETASHEMKHATDILVGKGIGTSSYWKKGSEALGRISGNRSHFTDVLTSSTSEYGIHPLLEFNKNSGTFSMSNAVIFLRDQFKHGDLEKSEGVELIANLNAERARLSKLMENDNRFKSLLYAEAPDEFDQSLQDRKREAARIRRSRGLKTKFKIYE